VNARVLAVDVDEVLFPFTASFLRWRIEHGLSRYRVEELDRYDLSIVCGASVIDESVAFLDDSSSLLVAPLPGAVEAIEELANHWSLVAVTNRFGQNQGPATEAWLRKWVPAVRSVAYCSSAPGDTTTPKWELCARLGASWLVDDVPGNLRGLIGTRGLLFGEYRWQRERADGLDRVRNWRQVVRMLGGEDAFVPEAPLRR
jgi:hypothetical protein